MGEIGSAFKVCKWLNGTKDWKYRLRTNSSTSSLQAEYKSQFIRIMNNSLYPDLKSSTLCFHFSISGSNYL